MKVEKMESFTLVLEEKSALKVTWLRGGKPLHVGPTLKNLTETDAGEYTLKVEFVEDNRNKVKYYTMLIWVLGKFSWSIMRSI